MKRQLIALAALAFVGLTASSASAQNPFPYNQAPANQQQRPPVLSPYLNLINRGNPAVNFFNFVQPQLQANQQFGGGQGLTPPSYQPGDDVILDPHDPTSVMPRASGHPSTFGNTGAYFNSLGTIGPAQNRPLAQPQVPGAGRRR